MKQGPSQPILPPQNLPVVAGERKDHRRDQIRPDRVAKKKAAQNPSGPTPAPVLPNGGFAAQTLSGGENRGLKGGKNLLERAKSTYMKTEYSGPNDRRPSPGLIKKTEI